MSAVTRGGRNAFRNPIRTVSVALIVGLSIGLSLVMVLSVEAVQLRIDSVKSAIGSRITISPAGSVMGVGGAPLTSSQLGDLASIAHVTAVIKTVSAQMQPGKDTSLQTSVHFGAAQGSPMGAITMPVFGGGTSDVNHDKLTSGHNLTIVSGTKIDPASSGTVAEVGKGIAQVNHLKVGDTFTAYGTPVKVVGIFNGDNNMWVNNRVVFPLATLQRISQRPDQVSMVYVSVDAPENIAAVAKQISANAGPMAELTTTGDVLSQAIGPLSDIKRIATQDLIGCLIAGAVIVFLTMLMVVRERRREIGVLKAIGASNGEVVGQFVSEATVLALIGAVVGGVLGAVMARPVFNQLVMAGHATQQSQGTGVPMSSTALEIGFKAGWGAFTVVRNASSGLHATVGFGIVAWGLLVALLIAAAGSAIPAWLTARIRPAEVLRGE